MAVGLGRIAALLGGLTLLAACGSRSTFSNRGTVPPVSAIQSANAAG